MCKSARASSSARPPAGRPAFMACRGGIRPATTPDGKRHGNGRKRRTAFIAGVVFSDEIAEQPSQQRKRGDRSDENEAGPAADHLHRQILTLQEVAECRRVAAGLSVSLSRHEVYYATEGGRHIGKMQRMNSSYLA